MEVDSLSSTGKLPSPPPTPSQDSARSSEPREGVLGSVLLILTGGEGNELARFNPSTVVPGKTANQATEPPLPDEITSSDELYLTGLHLEQYRHATRSPVPYWQEALSRDPGDARCNNAMGLYHFRRGEFELARGFFENAIERLTFRNPNPLDGEPYYNLGLTLRFLLRDKEANDAFGKAVWNSAWQGPGYHAMAELACKRGDYAKALDSVNRSLRKDTDNLRARNLKAMILSQLGRDGEAKVLVAETLALDPLDWWARYLAGQELTCDNATRIDLAIDLSRAGFAVAALEVLSGANLTAIDGTVPMIHFHSASLLHSLSRAEEAGEQLRLAALAPADYCFPSRLEDIAALGARALSPLGRPDTQSGDFGVGSIPGALPPAPSPTVAQTSTSGGGETPDPGTPSRASDDRAEVWEGAGGGLESISPIDRMSTSIPNPFLLRPAQTSGSQEEGAFRAAYYLGNLLYDRRRHKEAIAMWQLAVQGEPENAIAHRNLGIGFFNVLGKPTEAKAAYENAVAAAPDDARLRYERDQLWKRVGVSPKQRLAELQKRPDLIAKRDDLTIEYCLLVNATGKPEEAAQVLAQRKFQPWEGGEGQALGAWSRSHLALGLQQLEKANAQQAKSHFEQALFPPENLSEARHLLANASDIWLALGDANIALGNDQEARKWWTRAAEFKGDFQEMSVIPFSELTYFQAFALKRLGRETEATALLKALDNYAHELGQTKAKIDYFATSLPTMLLFDDDLQRRQDNSARFMQAQAAAGLGETEKAVSLLGEVLRVDPNHALATDLRNELLTK